MKKLYSLMASIALIGVSLSSSANATCSWTVISNGTTADANQLMNNLDCLASKSNPSFAGNVGIGTSTPAYPLDVFPSSGSSLIRAKSSSTTGAYFYSDSGSDTLGGYYWLNNGNARWAAQSVSGDMQFYSYTASATILTLTGAGNVGIGSTTPSYRLYVNGSAGGTSAYQNVSDIRLKKNIRELKGGLALLSHLNGVRFDWRTPPERIIGRDRNLAVGMPQVGFIAQEVMKVLPEAVSKGDDGVYSVAESKLVPVLVEAVKELKVSNDSLVREVGDLRSQLAAIKEKKTVGEPRRLRMSAAIMD